MRRVLTPRHPPAEHCCHPGHRHHDDLAHQLTPHNSYGWAAFIAAGGGAYYFAKRSINADRARRAEEDHQKRLRQYQLEQAYLSSGAPPMNPSAPGSVTAEVAKKRREREDKDWHEQTDEASNPSQEASKDPAPTRHAPEDEGQKMREKSKYEASDVFRSRKGDRFS